ncbi:MAG: excinuclease ABC subunit UvrC [Catenulispora sp.]|nr:excinuclease ABC subunit UvrC [Catenulispora sp.]
MADPATSRPKPGEIPTSPGVYKFRDPHGRVIYVGKAKSLRSRLTSYFQDLANLHVRTQTMVTTAASVEWTVVGTEVEALQLEYTWIKQFEPRFNVKYRDDKSYPSLAVTVGEEYPRAQVMRGPKRAGVRYFGPYSHAWAIRETLDSLLRVFPIRTCSAGVFKRAAQTGRPCLLGYIGKCSAPCVGRVGAEEHREIVDDFVSFMAGRTDRFIRGLEEEMKAAAKELEFEKAARLRDDLQALKQTLEKQAVVLGDGTDADVIALAEDPLEAAVQVFHVRGGRIRGQRGWVVDRVEDVDTAGLVEHFLQQLYGSEQGEPGVDTETIPREILVPQLPASTEAITEWLAERRGAKVEIRVPKRGDKAALMETVGQNAKQALVLHKTRRASDLTTRSVALQELADALGMDQAPLRIECFDISHLQGTNVVASMVVFEDGLPRKSEYRRFIIKGSDEAGASNDDVRSMHEVISRRFKAYLKEQAETRLLDEDALADLVAGGERKKFAYPPQLLVVDGGQPQVAAAAAALADLEISDVTLIGLAKRLEEVWLPDDDDPILLPRSSEGLYLLQRVRDEAHRFGIAFHRQKRSKSMVASALDDVPGLGEVRRKAVLAHFGTLRKLRAASVGEIAEVPGIGPATAQQIHGALAELPASRAVNAATGEILEGGESRNQPDEE